ncbi:hypothetical protein RFI_34681, partial [Reticulomyxa filosa]
KKAKCEIYKQEVKELIDKLNEKEAIKNNTMELEILTKQYKEIHKYKIKGDIWRERYVELWTDGNWREYNEKGILLNVINISLYQNICALYDCQFSI